MLKRTEIVDKFIELVQIDSESRFERKMADRVKSELLDLGLQVREDDTGARIGSYTGNIIGKLKGTNYELPTICLIAHLDTVVPGQNIKPIIKNGVIFSQGQTILGADDKAGVTVILAILEILIKNNYDYGDIEVVFTVCEEEGLLGAKNLDFSMLEADMGIVYDSDGEIGSIITEGPAQDKIRVVIQGESAHAGKNPHKGINAIKVASIALSNMKLGQIDEETTANIGVIEGGKATNIIPDRVELKGEARSRDEEKLDIQMEHMINVFEKSAEKFGAEVDIDDNRLFSAFHLNSKLPVVQAAVSGGKHLEIDPKIVSSGGGSDTNIFNNQGIPTINMGIGVKDNHTPKESIKVEDLIQTVEYNLAIMEDLKKKYVG